MGEFKGTPGPWFWVLDKHNQATSLQQSGTGAWVVDPQVDDGDYGLSSHCWNDVSEADARLIAAAPELLIAAQALVKADEARSDVQKLYERACELARAAIASALGEEG